MNDDSIIQCCGLKGGLDAGSGSGGSIYIHCNTLDSQGFIIAFGGDNDSNGIYAGGNGRIRIECTEWNNKDKCIIQPKYYQRFKYRKDSNSQSDIKEDI